MTSETPTFTIRYLDGPMKIPSIKLVRELAGLGLAEAKEAVENQQVFLTAIPEPEAQAIVDRFALEARASIELIEEAKHRYAYDPTHTQRGDQPVVRLRWSGTSLAHDHGQLGDWTCERTEQFDSVEARDAAIAHVSASWASAGLTLADHELEIVRRCSARDAALERAIRTDDSLDSARVYADWLQRQGDPRGLLMALDIARSESPDDPALARAFEDALIEHRSHLFGPLGDPRASVTLIWRAGQIETIDHDELSATHTPWRTGDLELLEQLLALPICRSLRSLRTTSSLARKPDFQHMLLAADTELLAGLRELVIIPRYRADGFADWSALVGLERLELSCSSLAPLHLPNLRELVLRPSALDSVATGLRESELPSLRTLVIDLVHLLNSHPGRLTPLLAVPLLATLDTLRLVCGSDDDHDVFQAQLVQDLLDAPFVRDIAEVDLRQLRLAPSATELLRAHPRPSFQS